MNYRLISVSLLSAATLLLNCAPSLAADAQAPAPKAAASQAPAAKKAKAATPKAAASQAARPAKKVKPAKTPRIPGEQLVDINSASAEELKKLPGIGDAEAAKIIAGRPYGSKSWLTTRKVLPDEKYQTIRELIAAKDAARHMGMMNKK